MAKRQFKAGSTDQTIDVFVQDSSSTTGAGLTALAYNSAGLTCYYRKGATGSATALTLATQTVGGAHSDGGFVLIDNTNMPGVYRLDLSDTILATAGWATIYLRGATNMAPVVLELEIVSYDPFDAVRMGMTAIPNATAGAAGGIFIAGTNAACTITGNFAIQGGITVTQSSSNQPAVIATGNGTGQGLRVVGGSGAAGMDIAGTGAAAGLTIAAGTGAGIGLSVVGGGTSGVGISVTTTSGDGVSILPTAGHGIVATGQGASKHGMQLTGGGSGTCDGLKAVAGTGGVAIRGPLDVVTLVNTTTTNTDMRGTDSAFLAASAPANFSSLGINASGHVSRVTLVDTTTTNTDMRGTNSAFLAASAPANFSSLGINASGHLSRVTLCDTTTTNTDMRGTDSAFLAASAPANFSSLGINASGHISRVTLADTITTYTGNTVQTGDAFARIGSNGVGLTSVALVATGLDLVLVDGVALPKALQRIGAVTAGKLPSGAGTATEAFVGLDGSTTRVTFTVDASGNRTAATYNDA